MRTAPLAALLTSLFAASLSAACAKGDPPSSSALAPEAVAQAAEPGSLAATPDSPVHRTAAPVTGTVSETMEAASYTYVRLTTSDGDKWAAIPQAKLAVGDRATIVNPMVIDGFESPTMHRRFDQILFGTLAGQSTAPASSANPHAGMSGASGIVSPESPPGAPVPRATGANAHTIAEILAGKATLRDKPVTLRGRVTKYNGGILGKNWIHLEDGSVKPGSDRTILATSAATASPGDVVVVQGVLRTDKDFGAGYAYPVMLEDATISK
jgi:hypothetical protein